MVKVLGTGTTTDGKDYVMVDKSDFEELQAFKVLLDFAKQHGKEATVFAKLSKRNLKGTPTRVPKELMESFDKSFDRALAKLEHLKGVTEEDKILSISCVTGRR